MVNSIEVAYCQGLKRALSIRETVNTEIVYIEANRVPVSIRIAKQQLNFWISLQSYLDNNPEHPLKGLIDQGLASNLPYLKYYTNLEATYTTPKNLEDVLTNEFRASTATNVNAKSNNGRRPRVKFPCKLSQKIFLLCVFSLKLHKRILFRKADSC